MILVGGDENSDYSATGRIETPAQRTISAAAWHSYPSLLPRLRIIYEIIHIIVEAGFPTVPFVTSTITYLILFQNSSAGDAEDQLDLGISTLT